MWILLLRDSYVLQIRSFRSEDHPYRYKKTYEKVHNISPLHRCFRCDALLECARPGGFRIANWDPPGRALSKRGGLTAYENKDLKLRVTASHRWEVRGSSERTPLPYGYVFRHHRSHPHFYSTFVQNGAGTRTRQLGKSRGRRTNCRRRSRRRFEIRVIL